MSFSSFSFSPSPISCRSLDSAHALLSASFRSRSNFLTSSIFWVVLSFLSAGILARCFCASSCDLLSRKIRKSRVLLLIFLGSTLFFSSPDKTAHCICVFRGISFSFAASSSTRTDSAPSLRFRASLASVPNQFLVRLLPAAGTPRASSSAVLTTSWRMLFDGRSTKYVLSRPRSARTVP